MTYPYGQYGEPLNPDGQPGSGYGQSGNPYMQPNNPYAQPESGYVQNPYLAGLYGQQSQYAYPVPANIGSKPDNFIVWSAITTAVTAMLCSPFALLGGVAIYYSTQVDKLWRMGDVAGAHAARQKAKILTILTAAIPVVLFVLYILFFIALGFGEGFASDTY